MHTKYFDAATTELLQGINLIEASAGTGKTYAIAMLVLRFVVEQELAIDQILVVTFTKAATEELKDRVRSRLVEARNAINADDYDEDADETIVNWLDGLEIDPELIKQRLDVALLNIDQASIFTIHSFCQRVLREHALESGQLFDAELTDDLASIKQACVDDFWREQIYSRNQWQVAVLTAHYATPDELLGSIDVVAAHITVYPAYENLDDALQALENAAALANAELDNAVAVLRAGFADGTFKDSYCSAVTEMIPLLTEWLRGQGTQVPDTNSLALLTDAGLEDGLHGNKFRANKNQTSAECKADYLATLSINTAPFDALAAAVQHVTLILRRMLLEVLRIELDKRLQQLNVLSFDNLITRLADALHGEKGELLTSELRGRFAAALIDEFQDTDDSQWGIFSTVFAADSHFLYLIGDPKQAIYKFRGADIYSYLGAQDRAEHQFTLGKNWRSHPALVNAVNTLFQREQAFLLDNLLFHAVEPAKSAADGELCNPNLSLNSDAPMVLWQLPPSEEKSGYWGKGKAEQEIRLAVCNEIVSLLNLPLQLNTHKPDKQPEQQAIQPQDIAILVRSNRQAQAYQIALREVGVPAVLNSVESIFTSTEAADLYTLLQAVANPSDSGLLKQALTLSWFALDGQGLYALLNNETELDNWMARFLNYYQEWQKLGLMAMMQKLLTQEKIRQHLANTASVERQLTNIYHAIELTHQAAMNDHLGINKTLDWLHAAMHRDSQSETQQLRLESDDDAVQIVTMHRSKGLEYPIVFCPCLWEDRAVNDKRPITCHAEGKTIVDLGSEQFAEHLEQATLEQRAEDLRVFYVAVTRAKYRCYLAWANVRTKDKANQSAFAHLLDFMERDCSEQQAVLENLAAQQPEQFAYQLLAVPNSAQGSYQKRRVIHSLQANQRQRQLFTHWQMSSYTALSALSEHDAPELPEDKAREQGEVLIPRATAEQLPKGAHTGNVVHDLLENHRFSDLAERKDISVIRDKACQRYSLKLDRPEMLDEILEKVVKTPLSDTDSDFCLMNLADKQCLKEMPFYLAMQDMNAQNLNKVLQDTPAYQPLSSKALSGYLTGFIDLICEYDGRYYVMDYKTNFLADYDEANLTLAMREHNYGLQYWLYTVVLHRYLQNRLPDYDYHQHFGGVRYLFVRGMMPDVPMSGVYQDKPELPRINALATLFGIE
jgi:exodeoxyribonuclease V beta subunit